MLFSATMPPEIAELVNLNLAQVKVYIYRGRTALKEYIGHLESVL